MKPKIVKGFKLKVKNKIFERRLIKKEAFCDFKYLDSAKPIVFVIDAIIPEFDKDSGSRRLFSLIKLMLKENFTVVLMADLKEYKYARSNYIEKYKAIGVHVYVPCLNSNSELVTREMFVEQVSKKADFIWLHRPGIFDKYYSIAKKAASKAKFIYDMVDFHYLRLKREWELNQNKETLKEANAYLEIELNACKNADEIILISKDDKVALNDFDVDLSKTTILSNVHNFVEDIVKTPFEDRKDLLFVGGFSHTPNVDAIRYLHDKIMPLIWKTIPELKVNIIGSYPTDDVLALHSEKFNVLGFVEDITPYFKSAKVFIAPLRYGAGIKGKIGQSLEYALPVVTTDIGAEGFDFGMFEQDMVANNSNEIAEKIISIYQDSEKWEAISNYSKTILEPFSLQATEKTVLKILDS
ncbi:glycosyltransferase [Hanstruepera flava]|uniref:glycosyltransferase n=1 Tax=Hanstruepera flava TaxID=2930218 RepID=UPI0020293BB1|nr:glycosyltransferase [Hanstruepera flava]